MKKFYFAILLCFLIDKATLAQVNQPEINFKHISYKEGLVQSPIANFLQDGNGFIWFGNVKGLVRYDGYQFKTFVFDENNPKSLSNNRVNTIFQDSEKNLWIGTANGVNLYNRDEETFTRIDILDIKGGRNYISSLVEDMQHNIWVGTFGGLKKLNKTTQKIEDIVSLYPLKGLGTIAVFSSFVDKDNNIWVGTKAGLQLFNPKQNKLGELPAIFQKDLEINTAKVLVTKQDKLGTLWFGTETSGAFYYNKAKNQIKKYVSSDSNDNTIASNWIKDILIYDDTHYWFATRYGISILDTKTDKFSTYRHDPLNTNSLNDDAVWSFLKDKASCVWIGTFAGGINFYYRGNSNFQNIGESIGNKLGLNHLLVNAISEEKDGSLWVGSFGGGLNHLYRKGKNSEYFSLVSDKKRYLRDDLKTIADDGKGNLWVGSLDGLSIFNKATKEFRYFTFPVQDGRLSENLVNAIITDDSGAWIGTNGGGLRYVLLDGSSKFYYRKKPNFNLKNLVAINKEKLTQIQASYTRIPNGFFIDPKLNDPSYLNDPRYLIDNFVTALIKDEKENLWVGTQNGLNYYDTKTAQFTRLYRKVRNSKYPLNNSNVTTLLIDSKKRLWVGTEGGGLNYFDRSTQRFYPINKNVGLNDDVIHSIVEDANSNLWISTDFGLYKLKFKQFIVPFNRDNIAITNYSANDGLISNQFSNNAGVRLKTNEIVFGGINGLSIFYPQKIIKNTLVPKVALTKILINGKEVIIGAEESVLKKSITETYEIEVAYDQANISFQYSALNYINSENNQYAYKLDGLLKQSEWQSTGTQREVNFANLASGTYYFRVKAANNDGLWGSEIRSLKIKVLPPWWFTWWAYLFYFIVFAAAATIVIRFLRNRALLKRDLYLEHVQNERQQELYQMKLNFFTNISHEIRTPLTLILGPLEKIISDEQQNKYAKQLQLIKTNAERLMKIVTELLDFRKAEEGHMKIHCTYQDVIPFCQEIYQSFVALASDKNINYRFIGPKNPLFLYFDKNQLEKVIINLLSNAFKFTPNQGEITLSISPKNFDNNWVDIKVIDNGKGIPEDIHDKLFESFFQVDDGGRQNIGSGIGLALSKSIVEMHKGLIKVNSVESQQQLTTFIISLQTGSNHLKEAEIVTETAFTDDFKTTIPVAMQPILLDEDKPISKKHKKYQLLIAEDNEDVRKLIVDTFINDYQIVDFSNGLLAMQYMEHELPDLIISDIMMPEMDGITLCNSVKTKESTNHIPFILLTAKASVDHQIDGLSSGADAYISKPFSPQVLALNIKNLLKAQEIMREKFSQQMILQPSNLSVVTPEEKFINKLLQIIEDKMGDSDFDVNFLVNEIGMSRTVLYKKVQSLTNYSVADLIKQMRLKKAAELFKQTTYPISEVAYMVGFSDRKHFSKEFKKQFDVSPSEYISSFQAK